MMAFEWREYAATADIKRSSSSGRSNSKQTVGQIVDTDES